MSKRYFNGELSGDKLLGLSVREPDQLGVWSYLCFGYATEPRTVLADVSCVSTAEGPRVLASWPQLLLDQIPDVPKAVLLSGGPGGVTLAKLCDSANTAHIIVGADSEVRLDLDAAVSVLKGRVHRLGLTPDAYYALACQLYDALDDPVAHPALVAVLAAATRAASLGLDLLVLPLGARAVFGDFGAYRLLDGRSVGRCGVGSGVVPAQVAGNFRGAGSRAEEAWEELRRYWAFIADPAGINCVVRDMLWNRMRSLIPLSYAVRAVCASVGVRAVLPYCHWNAWWWASSALDVADRADFGQGATRWLRTYAESLGIPSAALNSPPRACALLAKDRMASEVKAWPITIRKSAEVFSLWSIVRWAARNQVSLTDVVREQHTAPVPLPEPKYVLPDARLVPIVVSPKLVPKPVRKVRPERVLRAPVPRHTPRQEFCVVLASQAVAVGCARRLVEAAKGYACTGLLAGSGCTTSLPFPTRHTDCALSAVVASANCEIIVMFGETGKEFQPNILGRIAQAFASDPSLKAVSPVYLLGGPAGLEAVACQVKVRLPPVAHLPLDMKLRAVNRHMSTLFAGRVLRTGALHTGCLAFRRSAYCADADLSGLAARLGSAPGACGVLLDCVVA